MNDTLTPWALHTAGVEAWHRGDLQAAERLLQAAVAAALPGDLYRPEYLGALGCLLSEAGRVAEADVALQAALREALDSEASRESVPSVVMARYFLAEHYLNTARPQEALSVISHSIGLGTRQEGLVHMLESLAAHALNERERAITAARLALERAVSDSQRERIRERLIGVLGSTAA